MIKSRLGLVLGAALLVGLSSAAVAQPAPEPSAKAPRRATPWKERYWTGPDGVRFHYLEMGRGVPVILIHGFRSQADRWFENGIAGSLARTNRVIGIDMRNHGLTTPNPAPPGNMARDILAFMDAQGIKKAHLGGYSMGGFVVSQLMAIAPERFITAHFGGSGIQEDPEFRALAPADKTGTPDMERQASARFNSATAAPGAPAPAPMGSLVEVTGSAGNPPLDLTTIKFPVLQVMGEYDRPNANGRRLWRELQNYQRVILPERGHLSAIAPGLIHPLYIQSLTTFISSNNPK